MLVSAKTRQGIDELLKSIIELIPPPIRDDSKPLKALVYDSWFDNYLGALGLIRIMEGCIKKGDIVKTMSSNNAYQVLGLEYPHPLHKQNSEILKSGEIGILNLGLKILLEIQIRVLHYSLAQIAGQNH